jgi:hypothetical protein
MQEVFTQRILDVQNPGRRISLILRELRDLPASLVLAYSDNCFKGGIMSTQNEPVVPATPVQAILAILPFLAFGTVSFLTKFSQPFNGGYWFLGFYVLVLVGLLVGWIRHFPLWSYSYLGWTILFVWWWDGMVTNNLTIFGYTFKYNECWGWQTYLPLGIMILIALLWTRSWQPLKTLIRDIWRDWTRLSLGIFSFGAFVLVVYDENHHPYLWAFMVATSLVIALAVWFMMRSRGTWQRAFSLGSGFILALILNNISYATWDWHAYYGYPKEPTLWYQEVLNFIFILGVWGVILFWPFVIKLINLTIRKRLAN